MSLKLNSITKIEEFIVNSLLSSKDIPLDVNVMRLADTDDTEGVVVFPKSISVRFTGSNTQTVSTQPLILSRTMDYELEISCQNQQSSSGHDYATYLLGACARTLINKVPFGTGMAVSAPLTLERESFSGLTDSGHFVYTQNWSLEIEEVLPTLSSDPCVAKGTCVNIWREGVGERSVRIGEVVLGNSIYHLKPSEGKDCQDQGGVTLSESGDLVTNEDPSVVYLSSELVSSGFSYIVKEIPNSQDISVSVRTLEGQLVRTDIFCFTGKNLLGIYIFGTNRGFLPEKIATINLPSSKQAVILSNAVSLFKDPSSQEETPSFLKYGNIIFIDEDITLTVEGSTYVRVYLPDMGLYWIPSGSQYRIISEQFICDG